MNELRRVRAYLTQERNAESPRESALIRRHPPHREAVCSSTCWPSENATQASLLTLSHWCQGRLILLSAFGLGCYARYVGIGPIDETTEMCESRGLKYHM